MLAALPVTAAGDEFASSIRPVLVEKCSACHATETPDNKRPFLRATTAADVSKDRGLWRGVALQLRNRTMPPSGPQPSEEDRFRIATWIEEQLRATACEAGDFAGSVPARRLNRREYRNTIRDLFGIDYEVTEVFPPDGTGGEGFDTHGETLFLSPMLMERYLEAAQQILDSVIITPPLYKSFDARQLEPRKDVPKGERRLMSPGEELSTQATVYRDGDYTVRVSVMRPEDQPFDITVKVDGVASEPLVFPKDSNGGPSARSRTLNLGRGAHTITLQAGDSRPIELFGFSISQKKEEPSAERRASHYRLFGTGHEDSPLQPRKEARVLLKRFLPRAFRRPATEAEVERFMTMYDRAAERGDPYPERVKLMLKAVLVAPEFLFRVEETGGGPGTHRLGDFELANRLSYFLWSSAPDEELWRLASEERLHEDAVLRGQVARLLDDTRSRHFASAFVGQWLGTKDVGGRIAPTVNAVQHYYTPEVAKDMREEPILLFHHLLAADRSLLEFLDSDYTFVNERLVKFYEVEDHVQVEGDIFQKVRWPNNRRGGVLGIGAVHAMTSHFKETSPVLRGAWVLETLLGTPVPTPPPDIPPLATEDKEETGLTARQKLQQHREDPSCAACHDVIDPIGFGLENFDWLGRWRNTEKNGEPVDATGELPTGERFEGPAELRRALMGRKDEYVRNVTTKVLGYALGRTLEDADQCTIQRIVDKLEKDDYQARTLMTEVVMSTPFRYRQTGKSGESLAGTPRTTGGE